jgi:hypothetical protein
MDRAKQELIELQSGHAEREARNRVTHAEEKVCPLSSMFYCYPLFLRPSKTAVELLLIRTTHRADMGESQLN